LLVKEDLIKLKRCIYAAQVTELMSLFVCYDTVPAWPRVVLLFPVNKYIHAWQIDN